MKRYKELILIVCGVLAFIYFGRQMFSKTKPLPDTSTCIRLTGAPHSFDPLDFDVDVHHVSIRPVLASLITRYKSGDYAGVISDRWRSDDNHKTWSFHIRQGMTFSNGDTITSESVAKSITRIALRQKLAGSLAGLTEHLEEIDKLSTLRSTISGIQLQGDTVILKFTSPQPKLLDQLSFGIYAITHATDFDAENGAWINSQGAIASGAYEIKEWSNKTLKLALRLNFPSDLRHTDAIHSYDLVWDHQNAESCPLAMGNSLAQEEFPNYEFKGSGTVNLYLYYLHVTSWNHPDSPFMKRETRIAARTAFYNNLELRNIFPVRSFLPTSIPGIQTFSDPSPKLESEISKSLVVKLLKPDTASKLFAEIDAAVKNACEIVGFQTDATTSLDRRELMSLKDPNLRFYPIDLRRRYTGLLIDDPTADVKFMILSKEGIRLPDPTGKLAAEARKEKPDLQEINRILWDDAIVWPLLPFKVGLWAKVNVFDFSQLNLGLPPTDVSWLGMRR